MEYKIVHLPKEKWKGTVIPIEYTTDMYYDVIVNKTDNGFSAVIEKKYFTEPVKHTQEENNFPDKLYDDHWKNAYAWGVLVDGMLIAAIETDRELWSNRLRITELWVEESYRRRGIGHALIEIVREQARRERRRAVILETQSCNVNAIDFYLHDFILYFIELGL
jgi:ribosomal protein S18 acetylase RimI-like enzyme